MEHNIHALSSAAEKPEVGEYFASRGIGSDTTHECFICGAEQKSHNNISGFTSSKEAGERIVAYFSSGARLDYRPHEPNHVQVKIGACARHKKNLQLLNTTILADNIITAEKIAAVKN